MKSATTIWFGRGEVGVMEWPATDEALEKPMYYARNLYDMALAFIKVNFTDFS